MEQIWKIQTNFLLWKFNPINELWNEVWKLLTCVRIVSTPHMHHDTLQPDSHNIIYKNLSPKIP